MHNLRLSVRTLSRAPLVTAVAIISLALGVGGNVAIYSVVHEMLLAPLPVPHPERLVDFGGNSVSPGSHECSTIGGCDVVFSYGMFRDLEAQPGPFSGVAAHVVFSANILFGGTTLNSDAELVSGSYFPVLGVRSSRGRLFGPADDDTPGGNPVAVLSHEFWQNKLGEDPSVVGRVITVNGHALTVVGIAAPDFHGTTVGARPAVFVPLTMRHEMSSDPSHFEDRRYYWLFLFARLRPGVSLEQARARENVLYRRIINTVEVPLQRDVSDATMARFKSKELTLEDGSRGSSVLARQTRGPLTLLFVVTLIVLATACANIANLLLVRAANRSTEIAVRLSLGATRLNLFTQLLTEAGVIAVLGGLAGLGVALATLRGLAALLPPAITSAVSLSLSDSALLFACGLAMLTTLAFGLVPALQSTRPNLIGALRDGAAKSSAARATSRYRSGLVVGQMTLSMALLVTAGLFLESMTNVSRIALGVATDSLVTFRIYPVLNGYSGEQSAQLFSRIEDELTSVPGVHGVTAARVEALNGKLFSRNIVAQGFIKDPDVDATSYYDAVGPNYFKTLGTPMLAGREFTAGDVAGAAHVAIVNESFAKAYRLGANPIGKMIGDDGKLDLEIVGLVKDSKYSGVKQAIAPTYFVPYKQNPSVGALSFYVRSSIPVRILMPEIRSLLRNADPALPIQSLKPMVQEVRENVYLDRMVSMLSAAFAIVATLLAAVGLYGVLAYSVAKRTKEIGIRMALGADSAATVYMILRQVAVMALMGTVCGAAAGYAMGRGASSLLFGVRGTDPFEMGLAAIVLGMVAATAGLIPAMRASMIDPVRALRHE